MADKKKLMTSTAELAAKNLAQIQKIDPCATKILDKVPHTALYNFQKDKGSWEKTDVEGTFFVYQRADRPLFSMIIANRQSPNDYIEPIVPTLKVTTDEKYLFFCKSNGTINGLWFYDENDCDRIGALVEKLLEKLRKTAETAQQGATANDTRSAQLFDLIKGGQHTQIKHDQPQESPVKSNETPSSSHLSVSQASSASKRKSPSKSDNSFVSAAMPVLLQKLMVQEQPKNFLKEPGTAMSADELEKDLLRSAKPRNVQLQDFINSPSAASLAALSTRSVHGSEGEPEPVEVDAPLESSFVVGSGANTPILNKEQFVSALTYMLQTDDGFVSQLHQAYAQSLNRRLGLDA